MRHRLATLAPEIDRKALTLYGGLFLVVLAASGMSVSLSMLNPSFAFEPSMWAIIAVFYGYVPAIAAVLFIRLYRYAYPPDA